MADFEQKTKRRLDAVAGDHWKPSLDGGELVKGYKPDRVYSYGAKRVIVEIEAKTSRKGFIGGLIKASSYFDREHLKGGKLVFIVSQRNYKKLDSLIVQLRSVLDWLTDNGVPIPTVYVTHDTVLKTLKAERVAFPSSDAYRRFTRV